MEIIPIQTKIRKTATKATLSFTGAEGRKNHDLLCMDNCKTRTPGIKKVTTLDELRDVLRVLDLPGLAPPEFVTLEAEVSSHGTYTHDEGSMDER